MALPVLDSVFASSADLPRKQMLAKWLVEQTGSGSIDDFLTLPERYLYAKIAVSLGGPRTEQQYIDLPKNYVWNDIYNAIIFNRTAPPAPSNLTLTPLSSSSIKLDWVTNGASVAYSVERSVDGGTFQVIGTTAVGATTATNTGLNISSNYQYRIRGSSGGFFTGYSNTASASTYDANASSFVATSGATDIVAINDFVLGVKALGLWNSMVCWPLRSTQNAGTGTTAYSLGGLGTYNGTLVNGPTWGADGVAFSNASNTHIVATMPQALPATWMTAVNFASQAFRSVFSHDIGTAYFSGSVNIAPESTGNTWYFQTVNSASTVTSGSRSAALGAMRWASFSVRQNPETSLVRVDDSTTTMTASASIPSLSRLYLGRRSDGLYANMTMPFFAVVNSYQDSAAIRALYKQTLGTGLGLP